MKHIEYFQKSNASIDFSPHIDVNEQRFVNAIVRIEDANNFISTIEIGGYPGFKFEAGKQMDWLFDFEKIKSRSYALICMETVQKVFYSMKRIFEFGKRTAGDLLIHTQNEFGKPKELKHPELSFDYKNAQMNISYLVLASNVSVLIIL